MRSRPRLRGTRPVGILDVTRSPPRCYGGPMPWLGTDSVPEGFEETWEALIDIAVKPLVPAALLAAQALEVTRGSDWPVRRAAMEALLRRAKSAESEELAAVGAPARGRPFGSYTVARPAADSRRTFAR
jgi:hypothetical protein